MAVSQSYHQYRSHLRYRAHTIPSVGAELMQERKVVAAVVDAQLCYCQCQLVTFEARECNPVSLLRSSMAMEPD